MFFFKTKIILNLIKKYFLTEVGFPKPFELSQGNNLIKNITLTLKNLIIFSSYKISSIRKCRF